MARAESPGEFARRRGVSKQGVLKAIHSGRFTAACLARDAGGRWIFFDLDRADFEWDHNCNPAMRPSWPIRVAMKRLRSGGRDR